MSRFWKVTTVAGVCGLFYVGHGLNSRQAGPMPLPWENAARGATVDPRFSPFTDGTAPIAVTSSADGRALYFWSYTLKPKVPNPNASITVQAGARMEDDDGVPGVSLPPVPHAPNVFDRLPATPRR